MSTKKTIEYINAICASRSVTLLGGERLRRMAESENLPLAFDILRESAFGGESTATYGYKDYEKVIEEEEKLLYSFVKEYAPTEEIKKICLQSADFYNAEVILKSKHLKLDYQPLIQNEGLLTQEELISLVENGKSENAPKELISAVNGAKEELSKGAGGMVVGVIFARAKYAFLSRITKTHYLKELLVKEIDGVNLCIALRAESWEHAQKQIIPKGSLTQEQLKAIQSRDKRLIATLLSNHWLKEIAQEGVNSVLKGDPLIETERRLNSLSATRMIEGRYTEPGGTNPFMLYYFRRKNEISCVRTVLTGKANKLDADQIKRRLITV